MHIIFTEEERKWIYTERFGFPIKKGCPEKIKKNIEKKKELLNRQGKQINGERL